MFYSLEMLVFYVGTYQTLSLDLSLLKKVIKEFDNFGQNHGVTRFEKYQFFDYFKWMVL